MIFALARPRRNRRTAAIRALVRENHLLPSDLVAPFFLRHGKKEREPIPSLPGIYRLSLDQILKEAEELHRRGIGAIALFPVIEPSLKDPEGAEALSWEGLIPEAIRTLKSELPNLCLITDIALDPYTSHGHDGLLNEAGDVANDTTVDILAKMALLHAQCGVDLIAPSDMMDARVGAIRRTLDTQGYTEVGIIAYSAKYASSLYAPFREALGSSLAHGDKKSYQMDPANRREALREALLDEQEGADILMVKPALFYLDILADLRRATPLPLAAFHVSGEYAMVMAAEERGMLNADEVFCEALLSIKRAGADLIFSYAASRQLRCLG